MMIIKRISKIVPTCLLCCAAVAALLSCENDDTDFSAYINGQGTATASADTIRIAYSGSTATVTGDSRSVVTVSGADVTVNDPTAASTLVIVLSGSTSDGSLLVYRSLKYEIVLDGVSIANADGPAINNQCGKALHVTSAEGTTNTLTDGNAYTDAGISQKGTLFSEGQIYFEGAGTLNVNGNCKNGIASDDYIVFRSGTVNVSVAETGTNGVKVNDGFTIEGGTLNIDVKAAGARGIKNDARTTIAGGTTTITTSGDSKIDTADGITDTTSCACIKGDSLFVMTAGTLTMTSTGDGGKGVNCSGNIEISGGAMTVTTTGGNSLSKPKALKSDTGIVISGGALKATVSKSWACDNGTDSDDPADRITVQGTPTVKTLTKRVVVIEY